LRGVHLPPPPRRFGSAMARRQVFGLTGGGVSLPTSVASQLGEEPVLLTRSFPITAAGQSRIYTGFPLVTPGAQANRRSAEHSKSEECSVSSDPVSDRSLADQSI